MPREQNCQADEASRLEDPDNWGILPAIFMRVAQKWGPFTVDRFADNENTVCARFNSKYHVPKTEAIDCFAENWALENNWVVPPIGLIGRTIRFMIANRFSGVLGVPEWISSSFFPLLFHSPGQPKQFVKDWIRLPIGTKLFRPDRDPNSAFRQPFANSPFLFLLLKP